MQGVRGFEHLHGCLCKVVQIGNASRRGAGAESERAIRCCQVCVYSLLSLACIAGYRVCDSEMWIFLDSDVRQK